MKHPLSQPTLSLSAEGRGTTLVSLQNAAPCQRRPFDYGKQPAFVWVVAAAGGGRCLQPSGVLTCKATCTASELRWCHPRSRSRSRRRVMLMHIAPSQRRTRIEERNVASRWDLRIWARVSETLRARVPRDDLYSPLQSTASSIE